MSKKNPVREQLVELEKQVKKVIRKSLKDNTLDYTVQMSISSLEPNKVKYAALISSPAKGVQPITFVFDTFENLKSALILAETEIDRDKVEIAFHQDRITSYENKIQQHKERIVIIESGEKEDEDIEMEEV